MANPATVKTALWDGRLVPGPGAATAAVPVIEVPGHGHELEPAFKRMPIGIDHPLYPIMVTLALFPILMGGTGHHLADDLPEDETHPFFPDHFWPYPIIMVILLVGVSLLSAFVRQNMTLEPSADPRAVVVPRPDWYFLFLFQFLKLGPELIMSLVIPPLVVLVLLFWPFIDRGLAKGLAPRLGWAGWPKPGRNRITGTIWVLSVAFVVLLTLWGLSGWTVFGISGA